MFSKIVKANGEQPDELEKSIGEEIILERSDWRLVAFLETLGVPLLIRPPACSKNLDNINHPSFKRTFFKEDLQ